jgi:hypothetical protein
MLAGEPDVSDLIAGSPLRSPGREVEAQRHVLRHPFTALRRLSSSGSGSMRPFRELRATIPHYDPRYAGGHGPANTFSA